MVDKYKSKLNQLSEPFLEREKQEDKVVKEKDNTYLAIVCISIFAIMLTLMDGLYKQVTGEGGFVTIVEFTLFRCISAFIASVVWNPLKQFPWETTKWTLFWRIIMCQLAFVFFIMAVPLAPLSSIIIVYQIPFLISIIAFVFLREHLLWHEILGMILCFAAVMVITTQVSIEDGFKREQVAMGIILTVVLLSDRCAAMMAVLNRDL